MNESTRRPPDASSSGPDLNLYRHEPSGPGNALWLIPVVVVIGLAAWGWHRGWGVKHQGTASAAAPVASSAIQGPPVLDVPTLLRSKPAAGKKIVLRDALIQTANGRTSAFVGPDHEREVLVVPEPNSIPDTLQGKERELKPEEIVTITGTVQTPPSSVSTMQHDWELSSTEAKQVDQAGMYVMASRVEPQTY